MKENADMSIVKLANYRTVWGYIHDHGEVTIPHISQDTGLSLPTVTRAVDCGMTEGFLCAGGVLGGEKGRRAQVYSLFKDYMHFIFISIHCHKIHFEVHNLLSEVLDRGVVLTEDSSVLSNITMLLDKLTEKYPLVKLIGIAFAGTVNQNGIFESYDYPSLANYDLKGYVENKYQKIVILENDLHVAAASAECFIPTYENDIVVFYSFGDEGYGSAINICGNVLKGASGAAGKLTNLVVTREDRHSDEFYGEFLRSLSAVINPHRVVMYPGLNADGKRAEELAFNSFLSQGVPEIIYGRDLTEDIFNGFKIMAKRFLLEPYSEIRLIKSALG